jgi:hypothetical protein
VLNQILSKSEFLEMPDCVKQIKQTNSQTDSAAAQERLLCSSLFVYLFRITNVMNIAAVLFFRKQTKYAIIRMRQLYMRKIHAAS